MKKVSHLLNLILFISIHGFSITAFAGNNAENTCAQASPIVPEVSTLIQNLGIEAQPWQAEPLLGVNIARRSVIYDCSQHNSSSCTYKYNKFTMCCDVIWAAPGAYCPRICL